MAAVAGRMATCPGEASSGLEMTGIKLRSWIWTGGFICFVEIAGPLCPSQPIMTISASRPQLPSSRHIPVVSVQSC